MKVLVSACLLGENCKYNGQNNYNEELIKKLRSHEIVAVCPEVLGGLPVPRVPAEIVKGKVQTKEHVSVHREFQRGAERALKTAIQEGVDLAVLQSRSPSCGVGKIYDGSFSGRLVDGDGIFVQMLKKEGIPVVDVIESLSLL